MTVTALSPVPPVTSPPLSRRSRLALAGVAFLGPLCMAGWSAFSPSGVSDSIPVAAAAIAASPGLATLNLLMLFLACLFGTAGTLVVGAAVRRGAPRFGAVAAVIAFLGFTVAAYPGPIAAIAASRAAGLTEQQLLALIAGIDSQPLGVLSMVLFVCLPAGILLLGVAALLAARRRRYPRAAAILLVVCIPVVLVGGFFSMISLTLGWVLVAVAYGWAGLVYADESARE